MKKPDNKPNPHIGSSFDDLLEEEGVMVGFVYIGKDRISFSGTSQAELVYDLIKAHNEYRSNQ